MEPHQRIGKDKLECSSSNAVEDSLSQEKASHTSHRQEHETTSELDDNFDFGDGFGGLEYLGSLTGKDALMLDKFIDSLMKSNDELINNVLQHHVEIFWITFWTYLRPNEYMLDIDNNEINCTDIVYGIIDNLVCQFFEPCNKYRMNAISIIINPVNSSETQPFHIDYHRQLSFLWIAMTDMTYSNAFEYIQLLNTKMNDNYCALNNKTFWSKIVSQEAYTQDQYINETYLNDKCAPYNVLRAIAPKYSLLKMNPSCVHRGIPNTGNFTRILIQIEIAPINLGLDEYPNDWYIEIGNSRAASNHDQIT